MLGILLAVYLLAINFYALLFMRSLKKGKPTEQKQQNKKLALIAALGGGPAVYVCMFVFKTRLDNLFLMVAVPVLTALYAYLCFFGFRYGFGIPKWR